ncbi:hypothetical protein A2303_05395 [Candidatus Falkowbacteria bacterium RIFOXYB2_FULL_47_14]|uniref:Uncharacterized protein n=1 Tax=Candidatus Falkowbacteria bacterium RIFOXYA2_FULL_47_19 TaxID=1797994 RepID=A0A1F5SL42_9BACT|nr:MAG: hypothetical protein A2227_02115 [Candidatus Falkowbacteria bacterium RIFOXYA2_FULL_47_19]OGF36910.1 MAG: hypothetical protein A2468_08080 [Candidatus Falkowbacteria bacterium RIFOXYC2_FULL_46_15]OGF43285.1 MAG: hypothetical protein A2303_05395 [Candidatus Falkowbacteria bacterium RIFOXYB2_FULL_47_14]
MMPEKWETTKNNIKDNFEVLDEGCSHMDEEGGVDIEYIVFDGPLGRMRLEFVSKPVIMDKKTTYSKRIGSETAVEYVYSADEKSHKLIVYKWNDAQGEWLEVPAGAFA